MKGQERRGLRALPGAIGLFACFAAATASAHGGMKHVMGTVKEIGSDHLVVQTREGKPETVAVDQHTVYEKQGEKSPQSDIHVGDRVVVHLGKSADDKLVAKLVRFSQPKIVQNPTQPTTVQHEMQTGPSSR